MKRKKPITRSALPGTGFTTAGRKSAALLKVSKARRAVTARSSLGSQDAAYETSSSAESVKRRRGRPPKKPKKISNNLIGAVTAGEQSTEIRIEGTEDDPDQCVQKQKVDRALKMLHIDFNNSKVAPLRHGVYKKPKRNRGFVLQMETSEQGLRRKSNRICVNSLQLNEKAARKGQTKQRSLPDSHTNASVTKAAMTWKRNITKMKASQRATKSKRNFPTQVRSKGKSKMSLSRPSTKDISGSVENEPDEDMSAYSSTQFGSSQVTELAPLPESSENNLHLDLQYIDGSYKTLTKSHHMVFGREASGKGCSARRTRGRTLGRGKSRGRGRFVSDLSSPPENVLTSVQDSTSADSFLQPGERNLKQFSGHISRGRSKKRWAAKSKRAKLRPAVMEPELGTEIVTEESNTELHRASRSRVKSKKVLQNAEKDEVILEKNDVIEKLMVIDGVNNVTDKVKPQVQNDITVLYQASLDKKLSGSMESLIQSKVSLQKQLRAASRSSSPGGISMRTISLHSTDLIRSSSLDNLLSKSRSELQSKLRPRSASGRDNIVGDISVKGGADSSLLNMKVSFPTSADQKSLTFASKGFYGPLKRRHSPDIEENKRKISMNTKEEKVVTIQPSLSSQDVSDFQSSSQVSRGPASGIHVIGGNRLALKRLNRAEKTVELLEEIAHETDNSSSGKVLAEPSTNLDKISENMMRDQSAVHEPNTPCVEMPEKNYLEDIAPGQDKSQDSSVASGESDPKPKRPRGRPRIHPVNTNVRRGHPGRPKGSFGKKKRELIKHGLPLQKPHKQRLGRRGKCAYSFVSQTDVVHLPKPPTKPKRTKSSIKNKQLHKAVARTALNTHSTEVMLGLQRPRKVVTKSRRASKSVPNSANSFGRDIADLSPGLVADSSLVKYSCPDAVMADLNHASYSLNNFVDEQTLNQNALDNASAIISNDTLLSDAVNIHTSTLHRSYSKWNFRQASEYKKPLRKAGLAFERVKKNSKKKMRTSRWASGRLPKQSLKTLGKLERLSGQSSIFSYFGPQTSCDREVNLCKHETQENGAGASLLLCTDDSSTKLVPSTESINAKPIQFPEIEADLKVIFPVVSQSQSVGQDESSAVNQLLTDQSLNEMQETRHSEALPDQHSSSITKSQIIPSTQTVSSEIPPKEDLKQQQQETVGKSDFSKVRRRPVSRELRRLQRDEGAQKIMNWHETKKVRSAGLLLRSKLKDGTEQNSAALPRKKRTVMKKKLKKQYSVDTISDTRLVLKTGKSASFAQAQLQDLNVSPAVGNQIDGKQVARVNRGVLSASSSLDSDDGPPPIITEIAHFKDNHSERSRSEELSPPPLMGPEDPYSEDYFVSLPVLATVPRNKDGKSKPLESMSPAEVTGERNFPFLLHDGGSANTNLDTGIDDSQGIHFSDTKTCVMLQTPIPVGTKRKRGRPRKRSRLGPASKTGREPHVKPGPASSKSGRRPAAFRAEPTYIQNMPLEPRTFALRPKTTRSPIEIIAMRQKLEEEEYELAEATRLARKLKRKQAHVDKVGVSVDHACQRLLGICRPCSVVLVDFVKKLNLNCIDTSDQYISDVSYHSDEEDHDGGSDEDYDPVENEAIMSQEQTLRAKSVIEQKNKVNAENIENDDKQTGQPEELSDKVHSDCPRKMLTAVSSSASETKKDSNLDSLSGKGFMGNFVDFIQNSYGYSGLCKTTAASAISSSLSVSSTFLTAFSESSVHAAFQSSVSDSFVSSALSVDSEPSVSQKSVSASSLGSITKAEIPAPTLSQLSNQSSEKFKCLKDKDLNSKPSKVSESSRAVSSYPESKIVICSPSRPTQPIKDVSSEKNIDKPLSPPLGKAAEKSQSAGKLKVFPARRDSENGVSEMVATTRYLCTKCDFHATNKETIESHVYRHIPGVTFKCGYCESEFTGLVSALTHVKNSHHNKEPKVWISKEINEASLFTEEIILPCAQLTLTPADSQQQKMAQRDPPNNASEMSDIGSAQEVQPVVISLVMSGDVTVPRQDRFSTSPLATQRRFACTHCSYTTNVMEDAIQHVQDLHQGNRVYTCYLCDKAFGCSLQEVIAHCEETHPHRQNSFKKLPDYFDQELIRANGSSGGRSKCTEDRGNIFDRMSSFFPNLGPGVELTEDGQLSPQGRFLRARDYLYIQEGWSRKTSAEADSTTIEDIELPLEDTVDLCSASEEICPSRDQDRVMDCSVHTNRATAAALSDLTSQNAAISDEKMDSDIDLEKYSGTPVASLDNHNGFFMPVQGEPATRLVSHWPSTAAESVANAFPLGIHKLRDGEQLSSTVDSSSEEYMSFKKEVSADPTSLPSTMTFSQDTACGLLSEQQESASFASKQEHSVEGNQVHRVAFSTDGGLLQTAYHTEMLPGAARLLVDERKNESTHEGSIRKITSKSHLLETVSSKSVAAWDQESCSNDASTENDGETDGDILVINLDNDVIEDVPDDLSQYSTPEGEKGESALKETIAGQHDISTAGTEGEDCEGTGIKILSVVSLYNRENADAEFIPSPVKLTTAPVPDRSPSSCQTETSVMATAQPCPQPTHSVTVDKKYYTSSRDLPGVNADDIALRNERMVCTYKCHQCNVHSPALGSIVEHLKQHHHNVPLFSCPYCKVKKDSFFAEEKVHLHVSDKHPSNYAKNEVSLSETAKSFIQVLALPSGRNCKGGNIEQDIYMCLECDSHLPDLDYALRHLKLDHPGLLKYTCPTCGIFSESSQELVKLHMLKEHGEAADTVPLSLMLEGIYVARVTSISHKGQYCDHSSAAATSDIPSGTSMPKLSSPVKSTMPCLLANAANSAAGFPLVQTVPMTADNTSLVPPGLVDPSSSVSLFPVHMNSVGPLVLASLQKQASSMLTEQSRTLGQKANYLSAISNMFRVNSVPAGQKAILPMPSNYAEPTSSPRKAEPGGSKFQKTGMTVKDILDSRQKILEGSSLLFDAVSVPNICVPSVPTTPSVWSPLSVNTSTTTSSQHVSKDSPSPRGIFSMTDRLERLGRSRRSVSPHVSATSPDALPALTIAASVTSSALPVLKIPQLSSVLNLTSSSRTPQSSIDAGTSVNTLLAAASAASSPPALASRNAGKTMSTSSLAFSIAALTAPVTVASAYKMPTLLPAPASAADGDDPEAFKIFNLKPRLPVTQSPRAACSPAASALFSSSPAALHLTTATNLTTTAVTMASSALFPQQFRLQQFPSGQPAAVGQSIAMPIGTALPVNINVSQAQLLTPLLVSANFLSLPLGVRGQTFPHLPAPVTIPAAHQKQELFSGQTAAVNLSLVQPGTSAVAKTSAGRPTFSSSTITSSSSPPPLASLQPRLGQAKSRGRPRLNRSPLGQQSYSRPSTPRSPAAATSGVHPRCSNPASVASPVPCAKTPQRHGGSQQYCVCPYCSDTLKPWEVAQHIKVNHPGKEIVYNRV